MKAIRDTDISDVKVKNLIDWHNLEVSKKVEITTMVEKKKYITHRMKGKRIEEMLLKRYQAPDRPWVE